VECSGNISEIARRMGRDRSTVRYHLRRFGLLEPDRSRPRRSAAAPRPAVKRRAACGSSLGDEGVPRCVASPEVGSKSIPARAEGRSS
jgi:transposase-like protein